MIPAAAADRAGSLRRWSVSRLVKLGVPLAVAAAAAFAVVFLQRGDAAPSEPGLSRAAFTEATGIEIVRVAVTAGGGALDVRYLVRDAAEASVHARGHTPVGVESESGDLLQAQFGMHSRAPTYRDGHTYYALLVNRGGAVEQGDGVTVVIHTARLSDVVAQ